MQASRVIPSLASEIKLLEVIHCMLCSCHNIASCAQPSKGKQEASFDRVGPPMGNLVLVPGIENVVVSGCGACIVGSMSPINVTLLSMSRVLLRWGPLIPISWGHCHHLYKRGVKVEGDDWLDLWVVLQFVLLCILVLVIVVVP